AGGDPELGHQAVLEVEDAIRASVHGRRIVFLCTGLGGGTGSGAAPVVTRIAREEGAFVVVFTTMPFAFEGKRRRDQAETALNELAVLANALVTFDNNRMGELVLAKQGIHEAFSSADQMICESMKAVIRLVIRPGLINIGLDDLISALRTNRSRCLFGSGLATGKDRATRVLSNALASPLLDKGALLKNVKTVLVHLCGGEDLTLFEIEQLMQGLQKHVPEHAQVLFGAAVDPAMGTSLSLTLISALPEDALAISQQDLLGLAPSKQPLPDPAPTPPIAPESTDAAIVPESIEPLDPEPTPAIEDEFLVPLDTPISNIQEQEASPEPSPASLLSKFRRSLTGSTKANTAPSLFDDQPLSAASNDIPQTEEIPLDAPPADIDTPQADLPSEEPSPTPVSVAEFVANETQTPLPIFDDAPAKQNPMAENTISDIPEYESSGWSNIPKKRSPGITPWSTAKGPKSLEPELPPIEIITPNPPQESETPKLKLKTTTPQSELSLDATPRGRFEGENPNVFDGEDLDLPPFLRKKK
ncbi:MAG: hypothetical protein WCS43_15275, partial [Verrucomicrobiota bacterium]